MAENSSVSSRATAEASRRVFSARFIGETVSELRRVTWPSREETIRLTTMVVAVAGAVGIFLGLVDLGFSRLFNLILR